jgi:palmitoyltransferase
VCIHPPLTDEPRIALEVDDLVNVTRWRKHWLFGEKLQPETSNGVKNGSKHKNGKISEENQAKRIRGWFPRKSAVEFFEDIDYSDEEEINEQKKIK